MRQRQILLAVMTALLATLATGWLIWSKTKTLSSRSSRFIRTVSGLPQSDQGWVVFVYYGKVFAGPLGYKAGPITFYRIDPATECVAESITSNQLIHPRAIIARYYQHSDAWLADLGFFTWEIDQQRKIAYAAKPSKLPADVREYVENGFEGIYVVDMESRGVKSFIKYPGFINMKLHPSGKKLYVEAPRGMVKVLDTEKLEWIKEIFVGEYFALPFVGFSDDGKYLYCGHSGYGGFIVINTISDEAEDWPKKIYAKVFDDYKARLEAPFALSGDKTEIYAAINARFDGNFGDVFNQPGVRAKGGVIAIDLLRKKINRILGLSSDSWCRGTAVANGKLFVASRKDIFVIDIDSWRKEQKEIGSNLGPNCRLYSHNSPHILRRQPYNTRISPSTINVIMLDGGGSTKFGYRLNPKPLTYTGFPRCHISTALNFPRYLTTYIVAEATLQE